MKDKPSTVFVVDDDDAVRASLRLLLKSVGLPVETYASAQEFLGGYDPDRAGALVLDIRMPGMSGLELQQKLNEIHAIVPIVFITGHGDVPMAVEAMQHGAVDFIQKPFRDQDLIDRINQALEKDRENRDGLRERDGIRRRIGHLTPREREVLDLVTKGKANKATVEIIVTIFLFGRQPTHRRDSSGTCHGEDGRLVVGPSGADGH